MRADNKKEKYDLIKEKKLKTPPEVLCKDQPPEFMEYLKYTRETLKFDDKPDYNYLRGLLKKVADRKKYEYDYDFDWIHKLAD